MRNDLTTRKNSIRFVDYTRRREKIILRGLKKVKLMSCSSFSFFFQAEDGIRDAQESRGLGDVYKRQIVNKAD